MSIGSGMVFPPVISHKYNFLGNMFTTAMNTCYIVDLSYSPWFVYFRLRHTLNWRVNDIQVVVVSHFLPLLYSFNWKDMYSNYKERIAKQYIQFKLVKE